MSSPWRSEAYWIIWLGFVAFFFGKVTGQYALGVFLASVAYLVRHLFHINRLLLWLRTGGRIPGGGGIWEEIYYLIYRLRRRNKRRKKRLIQMLERFRTATAALPDATVVLGVRDDIEWFNDAAERLLGLRRVDIGQQIGNLIRYPKFAQFLDEPDFEKTVCIPSPIAENRQLDIRIVPYGDELRLLVAQDVTQLRTMERIRSDFVANVSHELRTPLTVLRGYLETLVDAENPKPEQFRHILRQMDEQTVRMQQLVDGLLSLTRLESGPLGTQEEVDVGAMLKAIIHETRFIEEPHATIELRLDTETQLVGAAPDLYSAFANLIGNALKYTPSTGHVTVRWRNGDDGGARLDVDDNGPGIATEHLPRLTERFYRVNSERAKRGVGLGLAIVKHVLSRHGAELKIASQEGRGSCFSCIFPYNRCVAPSEDP